MGRPASEADRALILQPPPSAQLHPLDAGHQTLCALLRKGPRAGGGDRACAAARRPGPCPGAARPRAGHPSPHSARRGVELRPAVASGALECLRTLTLRQDVISLQISSGIPQDPRRHGRRIDIRALTPMTLVLAQLRGRSRSVAAAKFADQRVVRLKRDAD